MINGGRRVSLLLASIIEGMSELAQTTVYVLLAGPL